MLNESSINHLEKTISKQKIEVSELERDQRDQGGFEKKTYKIVQRVPEVLKADSDDGSDDASDESSKDENWN